MSKIVKALFHSLFKYGGEQNIWKRQKLQNQNNQMFFSKYYDGFFCSLGEVFFEIRESYGKTRKVFQKPCRNVFFPAKNFLNYGIS